MGLPRGLPRDAVPARTVAATFLALAGVRVGELVVDVGLLPYVTTAAAAAVGAAGRVYAVGDPRLLDDPPGVVRVVADVARLPFAGHTVDKVLAAGVLDDVADPGRALAELGRLLLPGGRLVVATTGLDVTALLSAAHLTEQHRISEHGVEYLTATPHRT